MALDSAINFGSGINIRLSWDNLKTIANAKEMNLQYIQRNSGEYIVFGIDDKIAYSTHIFSGSIPTAWHSTQEENDIELSDFETNYKTVSNKPLNYRSSLGDIATAGAKGLGNFTPNPATNFYEPDSDERVSLYVDGEGSLVTRGAALTDEGSFRDEFSGTSLETELTGLVTIYGSASTLHGTDSLFNEELHRDFYIRKVGDDYTAWRGIVRVPTETDGEIDEYYSGDDIIDATFEKTKWISINEGNGINIVSSSILNLNVDTDASSTSKIFRYADYCPIYCKITAKMDARISNQKAYMGFINDITDPQAKVIVQFDGMDNTKIKFITSATNDLAEIEETEIILPVGLTTDDYLDYTIVFSGPTAKLIVNEVFLVAHKKHLPGLYQELELVAGIENTGSTSQSNSLFLDTFFFSNQDQLEIVSNFNEPIPVIIKEDQHTITGILTTSSITADQTVLEYTVPAGKLFYIVGYSIAGAGSANGSPVKIGKNDISTEPASPGVLDGNIFRVFNFSVTSVGTVTEVDYGGSPRKFAAGGDAVKIAVTPSGLLSTTWRASLDFILR